MQKNRTFLPCQLCHIDHIGNAYDKRPSLSPKVVEQLVISNIRLRQLFDKDAKQFRYKQLSVEQAQNALTKLQNYR